jgi:type IV pilus assembly protein PilW
MTSVFPRSPAAKSRIGGFSLPELLVAMAIGLFLIATIGYVFIGAKTSQATADALSRIQENARFAFEYMGRDIRLTGFTGGTQLNSQATNFLNAAAIAIDPNLVDLYGPTKSPRASQPGHQAPQGPLFGYDDGGTGLPTFSTPRLRGDILTVVHADEQQEYSLTSAPGTGSLTISCPPSGNPLPKTAQVSVLSDYTNSAVFQISSAGTSCSSSMTVYFSTTGVSPGNSSPSLGAFSGGYKVTKLYPLRAATYYIANNPAGNASLYRLELDQSGTSAVATAQEMVEGVLDMQIMYGEDAVVETPDLKNVTVYRTASQVADWSKVYAVRITLTLGDQISKTITNTIAVRNRLQ